MSVSLGMILEARERLKGVAQRTGLVQFKALSDENTQVYLKTEDLQNTGSFKVRGAYIKIANLSGEERAHGVIASSAGNHAQGVALAAKAFGCPATIVMPAGAPLSKVKMIRLGMMCAADVCIVPIQDWLGLDNSARMNTPGTVENNWTWRMKKDLIPETLGDEILAITKRYGRANWDALNALEEAADE